jgi:ATP-binding protein involved in chromosome partitioning
MPATPTREQIIEALRGVTDSQTRRDIVSLGWVAGVTANEGAISVKLALTAPGFSQREEVIRRSRETLEKLPGVRTVVIEVSTPPPAAAPVPRPMSDKPPIEGVKNLVAVASGKGGVGKTTTAVNLALALTRLGASVGLLDADIYGPNVPVMLNAKETPLVENERRIQPVVAYGLKLISMGLLVPEDKPMIWRGPMLHSAVTQFLRNVAWGELDYLIVDLPPGTGDVQLTLIQNVAVSGAIIVTTPSVVALADVRKAIEMFRQVNVEVLGVVENMSYFSCPHCKGRIDVFGHGEGQRMAQMFGVPFLGEIEIDPGIRIGGDTGKPVAAFGEEYPGAKGFYQVARAVGERLAQVHAASAGPVVQIL